MIDYQFKVGPAVIAVKAEEPPHRDWAHGIWNNFEYQGVEAPDLFIRVWRNPLPKDQDAEPLCEFANQWKLYREKESFRLEGPARERPLYYRPERPQLPRWVDLKEIRTDLQFKFWISREGRSVICSRRLARRSCSKKWKARSCRLLIKKSRWTCAPG